MSEVVTRTRPRIGGLESALVVAIGACVIAFPLLPRAAFIAVAGVVGASTALSFARQLRQASLVGLFFCLCFSFILIDSWPSQLWLGAAIVAHAVVVRLVPWLRGSLEWPRRGRIDRLTVGLGAGFTVVAGVALLVWYAALDPDVDDIVAAFIPDASLGWLLAGAVLFAMVNAAVEEIAYRGVLMQALEAAFGRGVIALGAQALAFGTLHVHGFPRGAVGVALATVYGLMMGAIRMRSRGLLVAWAAHVATDVTIATILLFLVR